MGANGGHLSKGVDVKRRGPPKARATRERPWQRAEKAWQRVEGVATAWKGVATRWKGVGRARGKRGRRGRRGRRRKGVKSWKKRYREGVGNAGEKARTRRRGRPRQRVERRGNGVEAAATA